MVEFNVRQKCSISAREPAKGDSPVQGEAMLYGSIKLNIERRVLHGKI